MKIRTLTAAAILAIAASSVNAGDPGGLLNESVEREVDEPVMLPAPSSSEPTWIVIAVLALLAAVAAGGSGGGT